MAGRPSPPAIRLQPLRLEPRRSLTGALAAFGTRNLVRLVHWRARREVEAQMRRPPSDQVFRGFIQINLIRPH